MPYPKKIPIDKLPDKYRLRLRAITSDKYLVYYSGLGGSTIDSAIKALEQDHKQRQKESSR